MKRVHAGIKFKILRSLLERRKQKIATPGRITNDEVVSSYLKAAATR